MLIEANTHIETLLDKAHLAALETNKSWDSATQSIDESKIAKELARLDSNRLSLPLTSDFT